MSFERWYTETELERIKELRAAKVTIPLIAAEFGWTIGAVTRMLKQEGLVRKQRPRGSPKPRRELSGLPRGQKSYVLAHKSKGGMITVRLDTELHRQFAERCKQEKISINQQMLKLIKQFIQ